MILFQAIWAVLTAGVGNVSNLVTTWSAAALRALTRRLALMLGYSVIILVATLTAGILFHVRWIMPLIGLFYLGWMLVLLACWQTLHAAGLLAAFDLAVDAAKHGKPITLTNMGEILTLKFDFERAKELVALRAVAYTVFWMTMLECVIFSIFSLVPIWDHWELLPYIAFFSVVFRLLCTPWGEHSIFGKLKPLLLIVLVLMGAYYVYDEAFRVGENAWASFDRWDPFFFFRFNLDRTTLLMIAVGLAIFGWLCGKGSSSSAGQGQGH